MNCDLENSLLSLLVYLSGLFNYNSWDPADPPLSEPRCDNVTLIPLVLHLGLWFGPIQSNGAN